MDVGGRKKRVEVSRQDVINYYVRHPQATAKQIALYFGITERTAQMHLRDIRRAVE